MADTLVGELAHRGPDGAGRYSDALGELSVELRHRRLSILDLSDAGAQPMARGGVVLTYNGELYNYRELRRELESAGVTFRGTSDTEVLLAAWRRWGLDCLPRLRGMFAFAVFDTRTGEIVLVRDHFGIKPLFYLQRDGGLLFASELKAIVAAVGPTLQIDATSLVASLLYYWVPDNRCAYREVQKLPPGTWLRMRPDGTVTRGRYWCPGRAAEEAAGGPYPDLAAVVTDSVQRHLLSDVPVSAFLSGGLDSSYLTALAARHQPGITAYTIGFRGADARLEAMSDDLRYARQVAASFGVRLSEIEIAPDIRDLLPLMVHHLDEPIGDPAAINTYLICTAARAAGIKVLLSGMGADELFAGYRRHAAVLLGERYRRVPAPVRGAVRAAVGRLPVSGAGRGFRSVRFAKRFLTFAELGEQAAFQRSYALYDRAELIAGIAPDLASSVDEILAEQAAVYADQRLTDRVNRMCLADTRLFLPGLNLAYTDRASMAASTEVRVPFVDVEVAKAAFAIPGARKVAGSKGKLALKEAASPVLPREIVHRPKGLFSAPLRAWMSRDLAPEVRAVVEHGELVSAGFLRRDALRRLVAEDASGAEDRAKHLWHILTLEHWYRGAAEAGATWQTRRAAAPVTSAKGIR